MKKSYSIATGCLIVIVGLAVWHNYIDVPQTSVLAQSTICCYPTLLIPNSVNKWSRGNKVKLRIHSAFTDTERQSILAAFNEWNDNKFLNCSNVTFDTANIVIANAQATSESEIILSHWVEFNALIPRGFQALTATSSRPSSATTIFGYLRQL